RACQSRLGARTQFRAGHAMGRRKCRPSAGACGGPGECWGRRHPGGRRYHHARRASSHDRHSDCDGRGRRSIRRRTRKELGAAPGGNVTGFSSTQADIEGKGLEIFKDMVPGLALVAVLVPRIARNLFASAQEGAAKALGIDLLYIDLPGPEAAGTAMRQAISAGAQGALMRVGPFTSSSQRQAIVDLAAELRLPMSYDRRDVHLEPDELGRDLGETFLASLCPAIFDGDGSILNPAEFVQPLYKSVDRRPLKRRVICSQKPDGWQLRRLLRPPRRRAA